MNSSSYLSNLSTNELVERFKEASFKGRPPKELMEELAKRPGVAFIQATDSSEVTLEKARTAIQQVESVDN